MRGFPAPPRRCRGGAGLLLLFCVAAALLLPAAPGWSRAAAGLNNQPKPPAAAIEKIRSAVRDILGSGDLGSARPSLYMTVEAHATTDLTDLLASVVRDDTTYNGLVLTFEEAMLRTRTGADASFTAYNLARLHLLRARVLPTTAARNAVLSQTDPLIARFTKDAPRDAGAWDLAADIAVERNQTERAVAAYSRIATTGAPSAAAYAQLKIAGAYQRGNRFDLADDAYRRGIRADAGTGRALLHALYQGLASLYLQRGNDPAALDALAQSARVQPDPAAPYRLRLDVAQRLLRRGHARQVLAYAEAAVRFAPEDEAAQDLRAQAQRAQASGAAAPRR